jgi:hypothetical protein
MIIVGVCVVYVHLRSGRSNFYLQRMVDDQHDLNINYYFGFQDRGQRIGSNLRTVLPFE